MKRNLLPFLLLLSACTIHHIYAQEVGYTAKDTVAPYTDYFRPGANMGYFPPYRDEDLANIAAGNAALGLPGVGVKALRPGLYDEFTAIWGYDSRVQTYQHFHDLGLRDLTCIVGFPAEWHREHWVHCSDGETESEMFANIYTDIWDDGENGTPYNDENYYAAYLYEVVTRYKDYIKFWEIWNEPGFDYTGARGWLPEGWEGNWWENDPDPCDYKLRAPIQFYVRTLRISWEIIKTLDPDSYVCMAGVGFPSFLDAVLRNTDNIDGGKVSDEFPHRGGAYFDVMGFHSYPDIDGSVRYWSNEVGDFVYTRHSDAAVKGIENRKNTYQAVLDKYGYDGVTYPKKEWIITEINIPRQAFGENSMGDQDAQLNFIMKAFVKAMENDIRQMHIYNLVDIEREADADYEYDLMGLYKNIEGTQPYGSLQMNPEAFAYKTASDILFGTRYDATRTAAMNMGDAIDGGAFRNEDGTYTYVLWAKTSEDRSEVAEASYSFPAAWNIGSLTQKQWDYSQTNHTQQIASQGIALTGRPIFLTENELTNVPLTASFSANVSSGCGPLTVQFTDISLPNITEWEWSFPGGTPSSSTDPNPQVTYQETGLFDVHLIVGNGTETASLSEMALIQVEAAPTANFSVQTDALTTTFTNTSTNATDYLWDFGDGNTSDVANPTHIYAEDGFYTIRLLATNDCGQTFVSETIQVQSVQRPEANFSATQTSGCNPFEVQFSDLSTNEPTEWLWLFSGGTPDVSTDPNPTVIYSQAGTYSVVLQVTNSAGSNTMVATEYIDVMPSPTVSFAYQQDEYEVTFTNTSTNTTGYLWDFGDGNTSDAVNPTHTYASNGTYTAQLTAESECGSLSVSQVVTIGVQMNPQAAFTYDVDNGCAPLTVQFTDASTAAPSGWSWVFEGGTPATSTAQNPVVTYENAGIYDVTLFVSNEAGNDVFTQTAAIEIGAPPVAAFTTQVQNANVLFSNESTTDATYLWDFGDGNSSTEPDPQHLYAEDGTYEVQLIVENDCGIVENTQSVTITGANAPVAAFTYDVNAGCAPLTVQFSDASLSNPDSWVWFFEGGTPENATEPNPTVTYTEAGTYQVTLSVSNDAGTNVLTEVALIEVYEEPEALFTAFVYGDSVVFNNMSSTQADYFWDFGDGNTSELLHPMHTYAEDGTYDVQLRVSTSCGDTTYSETIAISGATPPQAVFSADATSGCAPLTVQFTDESLHNPTSRQWLFQGGTPAMSDAPNPTVTYEAAGVYEVTLFVYNNAGNDVLTQTAFVEVLGAPDAGFEYTVAGDTVRFINTTVGDAGLLWSFGDLSSSNENNPIHIYPEGGMYEVTMWANNACGTDMYSELIDLQTTNTKEVLRTSDLQVFPNPSDGTFTVLLENEERTIYDIRLMNLIGQAIYQRKVNKHNNRMEHRIVTQNLPAGVYLLQLNSDTATITRRVLVE